MAKNLPGSQPYLLSFDCIGNASSGSLITTQQEANLPFAVKRVFWVNNTPDGIVRGNHANKQTQEIMVVVAGSVKVETESITGEKATFELDDPTVGLYIPTYCWLRIFFSPGTTLVCLASTDFEASDYILDLATFRSFQQK